MVVAAGTLFEAAVEAAKLASRDFVGWWRR